MPRPRKYHPSIPPHIDQSKIPKGIYWGDGRWYTLIPHPEGGRHQKRTIAGRAARLSDLHAIIEQQHTGNVKGTVGDVFNQFHHSSEFAGLAKATQKDYQWCAQAIQSFLLKDNTTLGSKAVNRLNVPTWQRLVEVIAQGRPAQGDSEAILPAPSKANHMLRYARRAFAWGIRHGHCTTNPAHGVKQAKERTRYRMPDLKTFAAIHAFAAERGQRQAHSIGSVAPYLAAAMTFAYGLRLRGIEVCTLTNAHHKPEGILSNRRKGSRDNITRWNDELRSAWDWLVQYRAARWASHKRATPLRPENRFLFVNQSGARLSKSSLDTAWQRMIVMAIMEGVITEEERFSLHGLKHRGITDSEDKRSGGHRTEAMRERYDHEIPIVEPPKKPEFSR
ncbi:integrase [Xylella fastidiosa subsp. multiplex]|uniref:site-specific integrase n=1 Tax=Xylella fastidiosa TaxID=2371 RepID=UPI002361DFC3|nr:integrase [Xylella fastidiosa]MDD0927283.1 integrase [Xylella fastidiosa subsp. multiplex]